MFLDFSLRLFSINIFAAKQIDVGRKKNLPLIEDLEIVDVAAEGNSIGKYNDMVVFVPGLIPGDIVDVQVRRRRRNFMEAYVVNFKKLSALRAEPFCSHFGICGGCKWQNLPYENQLIYKQKQVADNLQRIGKVSLPEINPIKGSAMQRGYRNKLEYTFSETRWLTREELAEGGEYTDRRALGFHIPGKFDRILNIDTCYLQDDRSNQIRNAVREFTLKNDYSFFNQREKTGLMRNLIIRNSLLDEWMVIVVFLNDDESRITGLMEFLRKEFPFITSLNYVINPKVNDTIHDLEVKCYSGQDHIIEELNGLKFKIRPQSFFQTNSSQALELYNTALDFASLKGGETVYDLYTGTGTIANFIARHADRVIGIEYVETAIADARINSELNSITNTLFFAGDLKDVLNDEFITSHGAPDVIITDPPRAGMHASVVQTILRAAPEIIVYVSCNPATQARDIQLMSELYHVAAIQPVDMFPHTHHVENVVKLKKNSTPDRVPPPCQGMTLRSSP